jgi:F420H(2)-dependent quinone reductase
MTEPDHDQGGFSLEKSVINPLDKLAFRLGVPSPADALLETVGRSTGKARVTPVVDGLVDGRFWLMAAHGQRAAWVRNIEANARVRVKVR